MTLALYRALLLGQLAVGLVAVALIAYALWPSRGCRSRALPSAIGSGLLVAVGGFTLAARSFYEANVRQALFLHASHAGWWLERREHLAVHAALFAITALLSLWLASLASSEQDRRALSIPLRASAVAAAACALVASLAGAVAAVHL